MGSKHHADNGNQSDAFYLRFAPTPAHAATSRVLRSENKTHFYTAHTRHLRLPLRPLRFSDIMDNHIYLLLFKTQHLN